ncbi:MAG: putative lipoic acid-binding regulatory protein [Lentisphaeria bacterium]|jgi:putative lipoic acid-binding regulatory protein
MSDLPPPKIEFPCPGYPIKVLGEASEAYKLAVLEVMEIHASGFDRGRVTVRDSRNGRFHSVTVYIEATGIEQLQNIFEDLKKHPSTRMVL